MCAQKNKFLTFSFDDGALQDLRLIGLLDKYGLRGTFNLNSELLGRAETLPRCGRVVDFTKVRPEDVRQVYRNHEVAVHTLTHPRLTKLEDDEVVRQTERDRLNLEELTGRPVVGMAYPCGGVNHDRRVEELVRTRTGVRYARTITSTWSFLPPRDPIVLDPTVYIMEPEKMLALTGEFLAAGTETPALFYIWGHSFELDAADLWETFEDVCRRLSGHDDVYYGTNTEVLTQLGIIAPADENK